jgi:hypothetical protein
MLVKHFEALNVIALALLVFFLITGNTILLYVSMGLLAVSIFAKRVGALIARAWLRFAYILGTVNSRLFLTLFFFLFLTPLAIVRRFLGHDQLHLKAGDIASGWKTVNKSYSKSDLEKTW